jgi:glutathione S-transferase
MALVLYAHPFSSYSQKALIALYENGTTFDFRVLNDEQAFAELAALWPHKKFPVLLDGSTPVIEASVIIEHLMQHHPGSARLIPESPQAALHTRFMDRFFDNYVMTPMQKVVADHLRAEHEGDAKGVADARALLELAYAWLEAQLTQQGWAAGAAFTLADCAAAPSLFYADWVQPLGDRFPRVQQYRARLLARPSVARTVDEARPYRKWFPGGAPERD